MPGEVAGAGIVDRIIREKIEARWAQTNLLGLLQLSRRRGFDSVEDLAETLARAGHQGEFEISDPEGEWVTMRFAGIRYRIRERDSLYIAYEDEEGCRRIIAGQPNLENFRRSGDSYFIDYVCAGCDRKIGTEMFGPGAITRS